MENYTITKCQIEKLADENSTVKDCLKKWFPDAFKTELEIGRWYKSNDFPSHIFFITAIKDNRYYYYGFGVDGTYNNEEWYSFDDKGLQNGFELATNEEVSAALIPEAKKRGFVEGAKLIPLYPDGSSFRIDSVYKINEDDFIFDENDNSLDANNSSYRIFANGKFAQIIPQEKTVVPMKKALKIIKGEKYICRKDLVFFRRSVDFTRGNVYQSENDGSLLNNLNQPHDFSGTLAYKHFLHLPK